MGCFYSREASSRARCMHCGRRAVNNLKIEDDVCEICAYQAKRIATIRTTSVTVASIPRPSATEVYAPKAQVQVQGKYYGEYKCSSCGRRWNSTLACPGKFQQCQICNNKVYAHMQRERRDTDKSSGKHAQNLCQMCQDLGRYCGKSEIRKKAVRTKTNSARSKTGSVLTKTYSHRPSVHFTSRNNKYTKRVFTNRNHYKL